jgi:hypothetical protein
MRPALLGSIALALAVIARVAPARAQAAPEPVRLDYDATAGGKSCPDESLLRHVVASHLGGRDPFSPDGSRRISVRFRRKGHGFAAVAVIYDQDDKPLGAPREMTDTNCSSLAETMGTIVLTWVVPISIPKPAPPPSPPKVEEKPQPQPEKPTPQELPPEPPPPPAPEPPMRPRPRVDAGAFVSFARLPGTATPGFAASAGLRWPKFSLSLGLQGNLPSSSSSSATPATEVRAWLVVGTLTGCWHPGWPVRFFGCGFVEAGALVADGNDRRGSLPPHTYAYGAGGAGIGAEVPLGTDRFAISFGVDVVAPFSAPTYTVYGVKVWSERRIGADLGTRFVALL